MKKILIILLCICIVETGQWPVSYHLYCKGTSKKVKAEGFAPIINNDVENAKTASLNDALKNALGLVVGIHVSQEAYVSKSKLVEDNILSQTQGFIESYKVLKVSRDGEFIKTKIKAKVRQQDIEQKIKELDLDPKKLGNPTVGFDIKEYKEGILKEDVSLVVLEQRFIEVGFTVKKSSATDILIKGEIKSSPNKEQSFEGMVSCRATLNLSAILRASGEVIHAYKDMAGGIDVSEDAASTSSIRNAALKVSKKMTKDVVDYLIKKSKIQLVIYNIEDINKLSEIVLSIRALIEVRACTVSSYEDTKAILDIDMKKGTSQTLAKRLESNQNLKIKSIETYAIEAIKN